MELTTISAALELFAKASRGLDSLRERAKTSNDVALKENISRLYDDFLDLKAILLRLREENSALRRVAEAHTTKPKIRQVGLTNYYFVGDEGPYCQKCYDGNGKLVNLMPLQDYVGGPGRRCEVCDTVFVESRKQTKPLRIERV